MRSLILCLLVLPLAAEDIPAGWPCWRGPAGGGSQPDFSGRLIDDPGKARQVWKSEPVPNVDDSGYSSPMVADGRLYVFYFVGDKKQKDQAGYDRLKQGRDYTDEGYRLMLASPTADEVLLCLDAKTGKTLWKYVSPSSAANPQGSNKIGGHYTPCVGDGVVTALGPSGRLFCLDAVSGGVRWIAEVEAFEHLRALRDTCEKDGMLPPFSRQRGFLPNSAPAIVAGVVVISDHRSQVAYDLATGAKRWQVAGCADSQASPLVWRHEGKASILGVGNCIDPQTGKERWRLVEGKDFAHGSGTPALEGDLLVFSGGRGKDTDTGASGWRLHPTGPTKLWQLDPPYQVQGNCTSPGIHAGVAYLHCQDALGRQKGPVLALDATTGEELARHEGIWYVKLTTSVTAMGDRVFIVQCNQRFRIFGAGKDFKELGPAADLDAMKGGINWGGVYANSTTPALVDGRMYFRGVDGVYCYDLRQP